MTEAYPPPPEPVPAPAPPPGADPDGGWQRLDPRMLLVHPVRELLRFIVPVVVFLVAGTFTGSPLQYLFVLVPVALGLLRYLTTSYRITPERVELRRGLLNRRVLSAPVDRVRAVDLTSTLIHRLLGLTTVRIGTGTAVDDDTALDLDGLPVARARELRASLLREAPTPAPGPGPAPEGPGVAAAPPAPVDDGRTVVAFSWGWLRFAPFTTGGFVVAAAALGLAGQLGDDLDLEVRADADGLTLFGVSPWVALAVALGVLLVVIPLLSTLGYLAVNWGFALRRRPASWQLSRGLLTTRETTVDLERLAGVTLVEPLPLRLAGGARLSAIVTGLDRQRSGSEALVPAAPRDVVHRAAGEVLGTDEPVAAPLREHGPAARRRRLLRALVTPSVLLALGVVAIALDRPWWLLVPGLVAAALAVPLALDRYRSLGHALVGRHLVARSGSVLRGRDVLGVDHVIGWNLRSTWFQRRAGLVTLVATTAGGDQAVTVPDVPLADAVALAAHAHPATLEPFLEPGAVLGPDAQ